MKLLPNQRKKVKECSVGQSVTLFFRRKKKRSNNQDNVERLRFVSFPYETVLTENFQVQFKR